MPTDHHHADETIDETLGDDAPTIVDRFEEAIAERDANYERFLRAQADLENYRRRVQKERADDARYGISPLARELLPVIDNLTRAIAAAESTAEDDDEGGESADARSGDAGLVDGVRLVLKQFHDVLDRHFIKAIDTAGATFDPDRHEAIAQVPSADHPEMAIVQEVERGWILHDRVLRPAKVIVSNGQPPATDPADAPPE